MERKHEHLVLGLDRLRPTRLNEGVGSQREREREGVMGEMVAENKAMVAAELIDKVTQGNCGGRECAAVMMDEDFRANQGQTNHGPYPNESNY